MTDMTSLISFVLFESLSIFMVLINGGERSVVFVGGREMKIFSTLFRDFGKNMVGKRYSQH